MSDSRAQPLTRDELRTPRVAAYAGIVFALLMGTSMALIQTSIPFTVPYDQDWLVDRAGHAQLAVALIPFSGIAFLWFMGVIRDRVGDREDRRRSVKHPPTEPARSVITRVNGRASLLNQVPVVDTGET